MDRVPAGLKRLLLPLWNGGHHVAWRIGAYVDAIRARRFERCSVCGRFAPILYRRWVIPAKLEEVWGLSPRLADALARKESNECGFCGAKLRARRIATVLLATSPIGTPPLQSVAAWVRHPAARVLRVAELNQIDGLHHQLQKLPNFAYSEYVEGAEPGAIVQGVRHEDLSRLTYADVSFDLILSSETLEHVPDLQRALREIHRVLAPGGWHLFTVPILPGVPKTFSRTILHPDGSREHLAPPICHPGGDVGYPVFTELGADFADIVRSLGFEVATHYGPPTEDDLAQVFACRKTD
jgi:SAM-dependent methyltransferase